MFATPENVKSGTAFVEVKELSDDQITAYIQRAGRWIYYATGVDYTDTTDEGILLDLKTATVKLVDLLWYQDQPDAAEGSIAGMQSERIGNYQYTAMQKATAQSDTTGIPELDMLLKGLTPTRVYGADFFSVSGPSDRRRWCR
nr:MAG TPA: Head Tail Connector Protein [Caudoviricetes sp.]